MKILNPKNEILNLPAGGHGKFKIQNSNVPKTGTLKFGVYLGFRNSDIEFKATRGSA